MNTFDDFVVFLLPIPIVWNLQLPVRQRLAVISLFALGLITCLAGVFKSYYIYESFYKTYDSVWVGWPVWIVSVMEMDLGVVSRRSLSYHGNAITQRTRTSQADISLFVALRLDSDPSSFGYEMVP